MIGYCFVRSCPHTAVSCGNLFSCCRDHKRSCFDRVQNPESLEVPFLLRKSFPSFTSWDLNSKECQKGEFLSSWHLISPNCGCRWVILASRLSKPVLPMVYSSLWSIWARDLLRQVRALCFIIVLFQMSRYSQAWSYPCLAALSGLALF